MTYLNNLSAPISRIAFALPENPLRALYPLAAKEDMISLANGHPSPDACDIEGLQSAVLEASSDKMAWRYGPTLGDPSLRELLASLSGDRPENLIITSGAQQGIDLAIRTLCDPGDTVLVPQALYPATLSVLVACGVSSIPVAEDEGGLCVKALKEAISDISPKALYLTPTYGNPTGSLMDISRRVEILELCSEAGCWVIEDDPYRDLWFDLAPPPSMWELAPDYEACVISLRSVSKSISPALRIGWMLASENLIKHLEKIKQASDLQASGTSQMIVLAYLSSGRFQEWLPYIRGLYRERYEVLLDAVTPLGVSVKSVNGGMFLWIRWPEDIDAEQFFEAAVLQGVLYAPGEVFAAIPGDETMSKYARLCFASHEPDKIRIACDRFSKALVSL